MSKKRALFICECASVAHPARSKELALSLVDAGFEVFFAVDSFYDTLFSPYPGIRLPLRSRTISELAQTLRRGGPLFDQKLLSAYVLEERGLIESIQPDIVIGDMRPSLAVSTRVTRVPLATISNAHWSSTAARNGFPLPPLPFLKLLKHCPGGRTHVLRFLEQKFQRSLPQVLSAQAAGINAVRKTYHLNPFENYFDGFTFGDITFFADTPSLAPTKPLLFHQHYLGPILWAPSGQIPLRWQRAAESGDRTAYVTLGSSGDTQKLHLIVTELLDLGYRVLVATAGRTQLGFSSDALDVAPFVPGDLAASLASLVVTNGGSPSSYQAFAFGKPVIGVCSNMDQILTATQFDQLGIGRIVRADLLSRGDMYKCAESLRDSRPTLDRIRSEISQYNFRQLFVSKVNHMLGENHDERKYCM